jgi:hypothetical protein
MGRGGIFGNPDMYFNQNDPMKKKRGLLDSDMVDSYTQDWATIDPAQVPTGQAEEKPVSYLQGGDKFGWRDGVGLALAGIGDAFYTKAGRESDTMGEMMARAMSAREAARKAQAAAAERQALIDAGVRAGRTLPQMELVTGGIADFNDFKAPELPSQAQMAEWYRTATNEQKAAYDKTNPIVTNGYGSAVVPRSTITGSATPVGTVEDGYQFLGGDDKNPNNWRRVAGGAGQSFAPQGFR